MDFAFSDDDETLRANVKAFIQEHVNDDVVREFREFREGQPRGPHLTAVYEKLRVRGWAAISWPKKYGGQGGTRIAQYLVEEEFLREAGGLRVAGGGTGAPAILASGTEAQKDAYIPGSIASQVVFCQGYSEPHCGTDLAGVRCRAMRQGDKYVINGQKVFITNGITADLLVLACKTDPKAGGKGVSLLLVETDRPGFQRGRRLEKIGCKAQDTAELFFADLRVPVSNLLGEEGRGFYHLMTLLAQERLVQAIRAVASAEAALEWTVNYTVERKMFGHTLADFQNTQFKLAEMRAEILTQRVFVDRCVELHLSKQLDAVDAAIAKLVTTELQGKVMDQCLQFFGGWGYLSEIPIARAFVDARMTRIGGGSVEVMKQIIGRDLLPKRARPRGA